MAENIPAKAQQHTKKKRNKKWIKWAVLGGIVLVIAAGGLIGSLSAKHAVATILDTNTMVLAPKDIKSTIAATGTVESEHSRNVYSTLAYPVEDVLVEVGDTVVEGDVLCILDSRTLQQQIEMKETAMGITAESAAQQVKTAKDNYNALKEGVEEGTNANLISAQSQVQNAYDNWQKAQRTCENYEKTLNYGYNSQILQLQAAEQNAKLAYDKAKEAYDILKLAEEGYTKIAAANAAVTEAQAAYTAAQTEQNDANAALSALDPAAEQAEKDAAAARVAAADTAVAAAQTLLTEKQQALVALQTQYPTAAQVDPSALVKAKETYESAKRAYSLADDQLTAAYVTADDTLVEYRKAVDMAYNGYMTAVASLEAVEKSLQDQVNSSKNALNSANIGANTDVALLELAQMQENLEKATVKAPVSGTVTAVYATVGATGSGLLFVIEDTEALIVNTAVKEYDIGTVQEGCKVEIRSDATGDAVYEGSITSIAPASVKNAQGSSAGSGIFETEVKVLSKDSGLRIGMSVRLNYVVDEADAALYVPYDAIYENDLGESCILVMRHQGENKYLLEELVVSTGIETDLDTVISGPGVKEGLQVVTNITGFAPDMTVTLKARTESANPFDAMMEQSTQMMDSMMLSEE